MQSMRYARILAFSLMAMAAACSTVSPAWTDGERALIEGADSTMRVLTVNDSSDLKILRAQCSDFTAEELGSDLYRRLESLMLATVTSPEQNGVGLAGPQVGLNRRIVTVERQDKSGRPFITYPNIRITAVRGDKVDGGEGCLSVPGFRGRVERWRDIDIQYSVLGEDGSLRDTTETVRGFTAVIFQHECDHLDGIIYTDKATNVVSRDQ